MRQPSLNLCLPLLALLAVPAAVLAQDAPAQDFSVTGSVTGISQYRLRGISVSDEKPAVQASLNVAHKSGLYAGVWASSLDGFGTFGGANTELDGIAGYTTALGSTTLDGGLVAYTFPGTHGHTYTEVFASVAHPIGPATAKLGLFYAPKRQSIGDADHLYSYGELALPLADTPVTLKAHLGYTTGTGSIYAGPRGHYLDYSLGADLAFGPLTLNLSYVGTDIRRQEADAFYTVQGGKAGRRLVDGAMVVSLTASF